MCHGGKNKPDCGGHGVDASSGPLTVIFERMNRKELKSCGPLDASCYRGTECNNIVLSDRWHMQLWIRLSQIHYVRPLRSDIWPHMMLSSTKMRGSTSGFLAVSGACEGVYTVVVTASGGLAIN